MTRHNYRNAHGNFAKRPVATKNDDVAALIIASFLLVTLVIVCFKPVDATLTDNVQTRNPETMGIPVPAGIADAPDSNASVSNLAATPMSSGVEVYAPALPEVRKTSRDTRSISPLIDNGIPKLVERRSPRTSNAVPAQPFNFGPGSKYDRHNEQLKQAGN